MSTVDKLKKLPALVSKAAKAVERAAPKIAAPQDEALRLAQQRAALPVEQGGLGLPAGNTPMDRANVMFPESGYHGSKISNIKELKTGKKILQEKNPNNDVENWAHDNREAIFISPSSNPFSLRKVLIVVMFFSISE